jgi:hypothetical protein
MRIAGPMAEDLDVVVQFWQLEYRFCGRSLPSFPAQEAVILAGA